ncbi:MAG TPA: hypothetical protein PKA37_09700 [Planctomycetota bacterium]|nr:hypothetical protein [Planctomycetota bacterium]
MTFLNILTPTSFCEQGTRKIRRLLEADTPPQDHSNPKVLYKVSECKGVLLKSRALEKFSLEDPCGTDPDTGGY